MFTTILIKRHMTFRGLWVSLINSALQDIVTLDPARSGALNEEVKRSASLHVTSRRDFFTSYTHGDFGVLKMSNDSLVPVIGMRDVRLYDPVQKKLVKSRDAIFIKDQTIYDIDETEKVDSQDNGDFDAPMDDIVNNQQQAPIVPPAVPLRRSSKDQRSSVRYSFEECVLLTEGGEHECYEEAIESKCKDQWVEVMKEELQSLLDKYTFELVKLPKGKKTLKN
ncbi:hypothetical protein F3Y22_tig00109936pilonHSYRG00100 [Hibiscus syriacus]|uniref:Retrovirus-related Pol polyprotein from transposon TNT 1-94 n=1 Tax=Hibiscus syriacus TaxID=106335 RepID=A0A6A3BSN6_HIBSY|nr:hypothetical protein F3Y22_tig00109936pilonHSYRG00100 [Hibiscus syriacus]